MEMMFNITEYNSRRKVTLIYKSTFNPTH